MPHNDNNNNKSKGGLGRLLKFLGRGAARGAGEGIKKKKKKRQDILDILRREER